MADGRVRAGALERASRGPVTDRGGDAAPAAETQPVCREPLPKHGRVQESQTSDGDSVIFTTIGSSYEPALHLNGFSPLINTFDVKLTIPTTAEPE